MENLSIAPKALTLAEALPFMRRYAGQTVVVKYGGHAMGSPELAACFARDIVLMKQVGINPVVVHGGGPQIAAMLERLKIKSEFVNGLRVTDAEVVDIVEMVLCGNINKQIVAAINAAGGMAAGLSGKDGGLITAKKLHHAVKTDSNIEKVLDLGFVGQPTEVNPTMINTLVASSIIPVIAPIGFGTDGATYNINADTAAGAVAAALSAKRLLLLTDVKGVLDGQGQLCPALTTSDVQKLIKDGTIHGGMIPKVHTCLEAVEQGVAAAVILDGRVPHALLLEMFTNEGAGTIISAP